MRKTRLPSNHIHYCRALTDGIPGGKDEGYGAGFEIGFNVL